MLLWKGVIVNSLHKLIHPGLFQIKRSVSHKPKKGKPHNKYESDQTDLRIQENCLYKTHGAVEGAIRKANSTQQVKRILAKTPYDIRTHIAAIKQAGTLKHIGYCMELMNSINNKQKPSLAAYHALFGAFNLIHPYQSFNCDKYIHEMIETHGIKPNIITATILLGACSKTGNVERAEQIWNDIIIKYNLEPKSRTSMEMIQTYGQNCEWEKSKQLYNNMISTGVKPDLFVQSAMLRVFIQNNQIQQALEMKRNMEQQNDIVWGVPVFLPLAGFYLKATEHFNPNRCLEILEECQQKCNLKCPNDAMMDIKFAVHVKLLEIEINCTARENLFKKITIDLPDERETCDLKRWNATCAKLVLDAHFIFYQNELDYSKVIEQFESFCESGVLGYWFYDKKKDEWILDFHGYGYGQLKFVLYYVLNYKIDDLVTEMGYDWVIICGKGQSSDPLSKNAQIGSKQFIVNELKTFNISAIDHPENVGRLALNPQEIEKYVQKHGIK